MPKFRYTIVPLHQVCDTQRDLVNDIYDMWKGTFGKVLDESGAELDVGDFFRCHSAGVLLYHDEVVGFNLFTNFDFKLKAHRDHPYFKELDPDVVEAVSVSSRKVMTMEYFTVSPLWRRQSMEVPWGEILAGLGLNYMDQSPAQIGVGTPRTDLKVDQMCARLGATIRGHIEKMNYKCAIVIFDKKAQRSFENPLTSHWVKRLWRKYCLGPLQQIEFKMETETMVETITETVVTPEIGADSQS